MSEKAPEPTCWPRHHASAGTSPRCPKCGGPTECGALVCSACPKCDPFDFAKCGICGDRRVDCTC